MRMKAGHTIIDMLWKFEGNDVRDIEHNEIYVNFMNCAFL